MPTSNEKQGSESLPSAETGILDPGVRRYYLKQGYKRLRTDSKTIQLPYLSHVAGDCKVHWPASPAQYAYTPNPSDGLFPYFSDLNSTPFTSRWTVSARNRSWETLMSRVKGEEGALAVAALEGVETFEMVAKRVMGLTRAYRSLRKGDFKQFLKELSVEPKRKHRSKTRSAAHEASGTWLEYHFGWSPTVQDIGSAALAYSTNPVLATVREHGAARFQLPPASARASSGGNYVRTVRNSGYGFIKQGATFRLTNKNLFLANRLGLINPASVAWEVVPFSFVVDWFTGFGGFLDALTDTVGLEVTDPYSTMVARMSLEGDYGGGDIGSRSARVSWKAYRMQRITTLSRTVPTMPRLKNFGHSTSRAATAVSLLTALFMGK